MPRKSLLAVALLLGAASAPAAPLPLEVRRPHVADVAGTTWAGEGADGPTTYVFEPGGTLAYTYNGTTYRNGTWKQTGDAIYFECNKGYYEFRGTLRGNELTGKSWNQPGGKWDLRMGRRFDAPAAPR